MGFVALAWNWRIVDLSDDRSTRERGEAILEHAGEGALIFGWWDTVPVIQYLQLVEGQRKDVRAVNRFLIAEKDLVHVIEKEVQYRSIYIDSPPNGLPAGLVVVSGDPVYQICYGRNYRPTVDWTRNYHQHPMALKAVARHPSGER